VTGASSLKIVFIIIIYYIINNSQVFISVTDFVYTHRETPSKTNTSVILYYSSSEGIHIEHRH